MDAMLKTGTPWEFIDPSNMDEMKIPKCADQFIRLLFAIKERYCILTDVEHQLKFLNLQLELIDSFRRRLVQLHGSTIDNVSSTKVLNAINYLNSVFKEWGESVVSATKTIQIIFFQIVFIQFINLIVQNSIICICIQH